MEYQVFLTLLDNVRNSGRQFTARCPAHHDQHNSLSVGLGEDGRILLCCHAGCSVESILSALGLTMTGLFPSGKTWTTKKKNKKSEAILCHNKATSTVRIPSLDTIPEGDGLPSDASAFGIHGIVEDHFQDGSVSKITGREEDTTMFLGGASSLMTASEDSGKVFLEKPEISGRKGDFRKTHPLTKKKSEVADPCEEGTPEKHPVSVRSVLSLSGNDPARPEQVLRQGSTSGFAARTFSMKRDQIQRNGRFLSGTPVQSGSVPLPEDTNDPGFTRFSGELREIATYPYLTANGELLFEVVRFLMPDGGKTFRQRRPQPDGRMQYGLGGVTPVLYRLPELMVAIAEGREILLCEGEKDADALAGLGFSATTAPMGAGKWRENYTAVLSGARRVLILPDNDKAGRAHAVLAGGEIAAAGGNVTVIDLKALCPALPVKGDVSDLLDLLGGGVAARFLEAAMDLDAFARLSFLRDAAESAVSSDTAMQNGQKLPESAVGEKRKNTVSAMPSAVPRAGGGRDAPPQRVGGGYLFTSAAEYLDSEFDRDLLRARYDTGITTGFSALDRQLDGHLYPGLYVIGSVSSLGKTAFCLQIADHIAASGRDVLYFTLEMSRMEMVARSLTRCLFVSGGFRGDRNIGHILYGRISEQEMRPARALYRRTAAEHIAFIEGGFTAGVEDVVSRTAWHFEATGNRPVVFLDYLQILRTPDSRMSDKQVVDHSVVTLKRLSRELDIPVIAVSSFNRQNYSEEVNMAAFKESGAIEYSADFVLGLQARGVSERAEGQTDDRRIARLVAGETRRAKRQNPRELEAVTLKNRRGPALARFSLDFYPKQNYFSEDNREPGL